MTGKFANNARLGATGNCVVLLQPIAGDKVGTLCRVRAAINGSGGALRCGLGVTMDRPSAKRGVSSGVMTRAEEAPRCRGEDGAETDRLEGRIDGSDRLGAGDDGTDLATAVRPGAAAAAAADVA